MIRLFVVVCLCVCLCCSVSPLCVLVRRCCFVVGVLFVGVLLFVLCCFGVL